MDLNIRIKASFLVIILFMTIASCIYLWNQHSIEKAFYTALTSVKLDQYLLECRRQEKNYLLRRDEQSVTLFDAAYDSLVNFTEGIIAAEPDSQIRKTLVNLRTREANYKEQFRALMIKSTGIPANIALNPDKVGEVVSSASDAHGFINEIREYTVHTFETKRSMIHLVNIGAFIVSIFLAVILSGFLTDQIFGQLNKEQNTQNQRRQE